VLEVASSDPPPSIFLPYLAHGDEPLLAIKVPRRIERREARPGMDLYDYLVCLYAEGIEVMQRDGRAVRRWSCGYRDIGYLAVTRTLLRGILHLATPAGSCDVPFNTTGDGPVQHAITLIRDRFDGPRSGIELPPEAVVGASLSFGFEHLLADVRRAQPAMRPVAIQGTVRLGRQRTGARRYLARATGKRLLESVHCTDGRELLILDRGQTFAYRWESIYGSVTTHLPLAAIRGVDRQDEAEVMTSTIKTDGGAVTHAFEHDHPDVDAYHDFLARSGTTAVARC
jgi:hypothetical protein